MQITFKKWLLIILEIENGLGIIFYSFLIWQNIYIIIIQLGINQSPINQIVSIPRSQCYRFVELGKGVLDLVELKSTITLGGVVTSVLTV